MTPAFLLTLSGLDPKGGILHRKRALLARTVRLLGTSSINELYAGDDLVSSGLPEDVSILALDTTGSAEKAFHGNSDVSWRNHDICAAPVPEASDLTVCLDLLIQLQEPERYQNAVKHLAESDAALLISGFDDRPVQCAAMNYYHEPLSQTLERYGRTGIPIDGYGDLIVFLVLPPKQTPLPRDLQESTLRMSLPLVQKPILLAEAILRSQSTIGFFPDHLPRCIEYPWIVERLESTVPLRVFDAGAGVSVLPFMLADRGHAVTTLDPSEFSRNGTPKETWNEWGYLDYSEFHPGIRSRQIPYEESAADEQVDAIVSVSVIEHLPAKIRRAWIALAGHQLVKGGSLLLTVDTVPFSDDLWCFSSGEPVEDNEIHGTVQDLLGEISDAGFSINEFERSAWLPCSRVGMARIHAIR